MESLNSLKFVLQKEIACANWTWKMSIYMFHCIKTLRYQFCLFVLVLLQRQEYFSFAAFRCAAKSRKIVLNQLSWISFKIEFSDLIINPVTMTLSFTKEKLNKFQEQCKSLLLKKETSLMESTKLIDSLSSAIQTVIPAYLEFRFLHEQQISKIKEKKVVSSEPNRFECRVIGETWLVFRKLSSFQKKLLSLANRGCGKKRSKNAYKFLRTTSSKTGITYSKQKGSNHIYPFLDRQQDSTK